MEFHFGTTGEARKRLVNAISEELGIKSVYRGMPTCAYQVGNYTIRKDGAVIIEDDEAGQDEIRRVLEACTAATGVTPPECEENVTEAFEIEEQAESDNSTAGSLSISMPLMDEASTANLRALVDAKGNLIRKALGASELPINELDGKLVFPWFSSGLSSEETHAYMTLVTKLCEMAKNAKRVNAKEKDVDNEKFAFRCFLLRLGFIGDKYKADRKILLRNLSGSSAFRSGSKKEHVTIPTPENTVAVDVEEALQRLQSPEVQEEIRAILNGEDGEEV